MFPSDAARAAHERLEEVERELSELCGLVNAAHGRLVEVIGAALDEDLWQGWGVHTPAQWVALKAGVSPERARQLVQVARRRREVPSAVAALADGALALDQAAVVARHVPAAYEVDATELARMATVTQLRRTLPRYAYDPDPAPAPDPAEDGAATAAEPVAEERSFAMGIDDDGSWWLRGRLPADEGAVVDAAVRTAREDRARVAGADLPEGAPRPRVDLVDGLVSVAERALRHAEAAAPASDRYLVHLHLEAGPADPGAAPTLSHHLGPLLPAHLRRLLTCDATVRPVLGGDGRPVSVGRSQRLVPRRTRRLVEHRDGGCAIPGCGRRSGLEVHHIVHWEDGGATDTANLLTVCRRHHRLHHRDLLVITGDADLPPGAPGAVTVTDRFGVPVAGAAPTHPAGPLPDTARRCAIDPHPAVPPLGERLDPGAVHLNRRPP